MDLTVTIGKKKLSNPVGVASGTFGYGSEYEGLIDISKLGFLCTKAVTPEKREGNDIPRIIETPSGLLNSIGLANVGLQTFISNKLPYLSEKTCAILVNVAGSKENDYENVIENLETYDAVWGYEINISCPNVKKGGLAFGTDETFVYSLVKRLREKTTKPLIIKLTPNVTDIACIAQAAETAGANAVSCINTLIGMVIDIHSKKSVLPGGTGGLSGPAIRPIGVAAVYRVAQKVSIPVIGIGGIFNPEDAIQHLLAGASAVQIGTANFVDPDTAVNVLYGIEQYAKKNNFSCINDFHGYV